MKLLPKESEEWDWEVMPFGIQRHAITKEENHCFMCVKSIPKGSYVRNFKLKRSILKLFDLLYPECAVMYLCETCQERYDRE